MPRPITTLDEVAKARAFFEDRLQSGAYSQEKYDKQIAIIDQIENDIRSK